jgi:pilus assembly protein CpaB
MQNRRILISLMIASALGLLALFVASFVIQDENASKPILVVASSEKIPLGTPISASQLKLIPLSKGELKPEGSSQHIEGLIGRVAKSDLEGGQIILERMLFSATSSSGLAFAITPGKRAMTMNVNEVSDVAGFITPGSYVDILFSSKDESGRFNSRIILQHALVLAVAQDRVAADDAKAHLASSVTLEVGPQQAEMLDAARMAGSLSLVLRNQTDGVGASSESTQTSTKTTTENGVEVIRGTTVRIEPGLGH